MIRIFSQYVSPKSIILMVTETVLITLSLLCAIRLRFWNDPVQFEVYTSWPDFAVQAGLIVAICQLCFYYNDLYDLTAVRRRSEQLVRLEQSLGAACLLLGLIYFLVPSLLIGRGVFIISMLLLTIFIMFTRVVLDGAWYMAAPAQNILILGTGDLAADLASELGKRHDLNLRLVGFARGHAPLNGHPERLRQPVVGTVEELEELVQQHQVNRIIVAMEDRRGSLPIRELVKLRVDGVRVEDVHTAVAALTGRVWLRTVQPSWFVFSDGFRRARTTLFLKRIIDICFAAILMVVSAPVMALVALAVRLDSDGPVIYRQARVGLRGRSFKVLKFRSMCVDAEVGKGAQWALAEDPRNTRVGRVIRKYRLDELPQFINVLRGDMSFVGPRPERPVFVDELRKLIPYYDERHSVRPGVTGWAQVQYQYGASIEDSYNKMEYDLFYLKNMSVLFDCAIVLKTLRTVLFGQGGR